MTTADDPLVRFAETFARAGANAPFDHTAATLGTATVKGVPSVRTVLVRGVDAEGLTFYTNYESRKGRELTENPVAALCFYWPWIDEQVLVEGSVVRLDPSASDVYFRSRPRGSQLGAWASRQSQPLSSREELEARYRTVEERFAGTDVPRPPHWGGFRLIPYRIEFWKAGQHRLHDREVYTRGDHGWTRTRLFP
ncbi:MAG TPA: pyridoxamine 5'-phosphate oxidase [Vicinamibacterales bacterium]|nr:pyridoxamine 5'-phosphate oxidase [Vicinamibacterales bacterium]